MNADQESLILEAAMLVELSMQKHVDPTPTEDPSGVITLKVERAGSESQFLESQFLYAVVQAAIRMYRNSATADQDIKELEG